MTIGGWITMCLSMGAFASLFVWCMYKVMVSEKKQNKQEETSVKKTH